VWSGFLVEELIVSQVVKKSPLLLKNGKVYFRQMNPVRSFTSVLEDPSESGVSCDVS
jgi:hypothetical protein